MGTSTFRSDNLIKIRDDDGLVSHQGAVEMECRSILQKLRHGNKNKKQVKYKFDCGREYGVFRRQWRANYGN